MNDKFETIKYLSEQETPLNIKRKSLRRIKILKMRPYIYAVSAAFIGNLILLGTHVFHHIVNNEAISVIRVIIQDFEFSTDYMSNAALGLKEVLPMMQSSFLVINLILVIYLATLFKRYRSELLKI